MSMAYEITVITPDGTPVPPRRVAVEAVPAALAQAAATGAQLRIRPVKAPDQSTSAPGGRGE